MGFRASLAALRKILAEIGADMGPVLGRSSVRATTKVRASAEAVTPGGAVRG